MIGDRNGLVVVTEILKEKGAYCIVRCDCGAERKVTRGKFKECQVTTCGSPECKKRLKEMRKEFRTGFGCEKKKESILPAGF